MKLRRILFWLHLSAGCLAGIVIFIMSVTGILLAFERQVIEWSNREYKVAPHPEQPRLPLDSLLAAATDHEQGSALTGITLRAAASAPVELSFGRERTLFIDPYNGNVLGEGSPRLRAFFNALENWHRWLGRQASSRERGRAVTGACNLGFLFLVASGPFLWWPKDWNWQNLKKVVFFRKGLLARARDWNWHNVFGIWCAAPLFLIVLSGVVMSYPWANDLLYRITGNQPPPHRSEGGVDRPESPAKSKARDSSGDSGSEKSRSGQAHESPSSASPATLDGLFLTAEQKVPAWQSIALRLPAADGAPMTFSILRGNPGRPDLRDQLILDGRTGHLIRWEPFSSYNLGRQLRGWARFAHTGEAGGIVGQTIALIASAGAAVLVWTGISLAFRRLWTWRSSGRTKQAAVEEVQV